jgi:uncharacterized protein
LKGIIIFIAIASFIVISGHALLYFSYIHFFNISSVRVLRLLGALLGILSISFIGGSLLVHWNDNVATRIVYYVASVWLGFLLYLFLSIIITWLIAGINRMFEFGLDLKMVAAFFVMASFLFTIYSVWNAAHPRLHYIDVNIKNIPASWRKRKAVQISDIHLGVINGRQFMSDIVNEINSVNPDIVFITGDLFDGIGDDLSKISEPLEDLRPPLGTYFITGNHETYLNVDRALAALSDKPIKVLRNEIVEIDGVELLGVDYPSASKHLDLNSTLGALNHDKPNIVLFHSPIAIEKFKEHGVNLQLAGHTHRGQLWPLNYITQRVYEGYDYGLHVDGDYTLYTSPGTGTWGPPLRSGNRPEITVLTFK